MKDIDIKVYGNTDLIMFFMVLWADVADFYILKTLLKKSKCDYIVLIGQHHAENFQNIFMQQSKFYKKSQNGCVDIKDIWIPFSK